VSLRPFNYSLDTTKCEIITESQLEDNCLLGCEVMQSSGSLMTFRRNTKLILVVDL
jgi:hypothetical protein